MMRQLKSAIVRFLIRHRILATPEEDEFLTWGDAYLDALYDAARKRKG